MADKHNDRQKPGQRGTVAPAGGKRKGGESKSQGPEQSGDNRRIGDQDGNADAGDPTSPGANNPAEFSANEGHALLDGQPFGRSNAPQIHTTRSVKSRH